MRNGTGLSVLLVGAMALVAQPSMAAKGLAGSAGNVKTRILFDKFRPGDCKRLYDTYIAAPGHSAFAATVIDYNWGGSSSYVCAISLNDGNTASAEKRALDECKKGLKKYASIEAYGPCAIYASK